VNSSQLLLEGGPEPDSLFQVSSPRNLALVAQKNRPAENQKGLLVKGCNPFC
jgi:hypothetical protein